MALPITPMLDMSFQLLFFFIATFHLPTGMEGQMTLAVQGLGPCFGDPPPRQAGGLVDLQSPVTIALKADTVGQSADGVSALTLMQRSGETHLPYSTDLKELRQCLVDVSQKAGAGPSIKVQGDARVKWRGVVKVMDACRAAGFEDIAFAQPDDDGSR